MQTGISNNTMSKTCCFNEKTSLSCKQNSSRKTVRSQHVRNCMFRIPYQTEFSPIVFVKDLAGRVTSVLHLVSRRRSLRRDLSSSPLERSKSAGSSADSYRTAAVEDCIEFIHSSFSRSNSSATTSCLDSTHAP